MADAARVAAAIREVFEPEGPRPLARVAPAAEPYPVDSLGDFHDAVLAIQEHTHAPTAICAQAVLGALALVCQAHADVRLSTGQVKPLSLFLLTVAASGDRKSAVDSHALKPVYDYETALSKAFQLERQQDARELEAWEADRSVSKAAVKTAKGKGKTAQAGAEADTRSIADAPTPPCSARPIADLPEPPDLSTDDGAGKRDGRRASPRAELGAVGSHQRATNAAAQSGH